MVGGMGRAALYLKVSPNGLWPAARSRPVAGFSRLTPHAANPRNSITHVGETLASPSLSRIGAKVLRVQVPGAMLCMLGMRGLPFWSSIVVEKGSFCIPSFTSIILRVPGVMLCMLGMQERGDVLHAGDAGTAFGLRMSGKKAAFASPASPASSCRCLG